MNDQLKKQVVDSKTLRDVAIGIMDGWDVLGGMTENETLEFCQELQAAFARALLSSQSASQPSGKPIDCSGDPTCCPDNEGRGCHCSDVAWSSSQPAAEPSDEQINAALVAWQANVTGLESNRAYAMRQALIAASAAAPSEAQAAPVDEPEWYTGVDSHGCRRFYHKEEVRPGVGFDEELYTKAQQPAVPQWQPIETAPKDGTHILAILPDSDTCHVIEWADASKGIRVEAGEGVGWHIAWDGYYLAPHEQPTHWMHLPPAPGAVAAPMQDSSKEGGAA